MPWTHSKNIVFLLYNPFSCGKFVSNILSYNKNFVPQFPLDGNRRRWYSQETYHNMSLDQLMDIKHETIMKTIPPTKQDCLDWMGYELGCIGFWGFHFNETVTKEYLNCVQIDPKTNWLLQQSVNCFFMLHDHTLVATVQENFPNCQIIKFVNDQHINQLSQDLKNNQQRVEIVDLSQIHLPGIIDFDIGSIFNPTQFFNNIDQLLLQLGIEDTSLDPNVDQYYQSYCNLYQ